MPENQLAAKPSSQRQHQSGYSVERAHEQAWNLLSCTTGERHAEQRAGSQHEERVADTGLRTRAFLELHQVDEAGKRS